MPTATELPEPMGLETPDEDLAALAACVKSLSRPGAWWPEVVEVGSWAGRTAIRMADAGARVFCVDTWEGSEGDITGSLAGKLGPERVFGAFCRNAGERLFRSVFPVRGESLYWAERWPRQADMVFIDADHEYAAVKADILAWSRHVRPGGFLVGHDFDVLGFEGVRRAVEETGAYETLGRSLWLRRM